jgi:hypothetical protein
VHPCTFCTQGLRHLTISCPAGDSPELPQPTQLLLSKNSTALKWQGPVPDATRSAVAGVLSELVQLPQLCQAVHDRLGASRLSALLQAAMKAISEGGRGGCGRRRMLAAIVRVLFDNAAVSRPLSCFKA